MKTHTTLEGEVVPYPEEGDIHGYDHEFKILVDKLDRILAEQARVRARDEILAAEELIEGLTGKKKEQGR